MTGAFWWWDDAVEVAFRRASLTGRRQRVRLARLGMVAWIVEEVGA